MERILTYLIDAKDDGKSILAYLEQKNYSRNIIVQLKKTAHGILVNNNWYYVNQKLRTNDVLTIRLTEPEDICTCPSIPGPGPVHLPVPILYEDKDLLVAHKPAGMPAHPSKRHPSDTLADAIAWHAREKQERYPYRCINRLDRDTSGLTIIAKNAYSSCILNGQMRDRQIHRTYYAIVQGITEKKGVIEAPIARLETGNVLRTVDFHRGVHAVTHYETLASKNGLSFVKLQLETGRTHQIRVHMHYLGHPLIGDFLYGGDKKIPAMQRQALHAGMLEFTHPINGQQLRFTAPLPEDMFQFFPMVIS